MENIRPLFIRLLFIFVIALILSVGFFYFVNNFVVGRHMNDINLCERNLGFNETLSLMDTSNAWYEYVDEVYYNCCYFNMTNKLNIGYKSEKICVGFKK